MGMYDTIIVEKLKVNVPKIVSNFLVKNNAQLPKEFQTKDLDSVMRVYRIDNKGQIFETVAKPTGKKVEWNNPFKDWPDHRCFLVKLYLKLTTKSVNDKKLLRDEVKNVEVKSKLSATFNIYAYEEIGGRFLDIEYEVHASKGKVTRTKLLKWSIESEKDANTRHKRDKEFDLKFAQQIAKRNKFVSKWYYPALKEIYNPVIFFTRLILQKVCTYIITKSYKLREI